MRLGQAFHAELFGQLLHPPRRHTQQIARRDHGHQGLLGAAAMRRNKNKSTLNSNALRVSMQQVQDAWLVSGVTPEA
jgi:hypothetical protein